MLMCIERPELANAPDDNDTDDAMPDRFDIDFDPRVQREVVDAIEKDLIEAGHLVTLVCLPDKDDPADESKSFWNITVQLCRKKEKSE